MKRYKVEKMPDITPETRARAEYHNPDVLIIFDKLDELIDIVNEVVLEEVKEECDCITEPCMHSKVVEEFDQPKEEKEHKHTIVTNGEEEECMECSYHRYIKDQPLTPKDVGMRKGQALFNFHHWVDEYSAKELFYISDPEFDRLYQQFLREIKDKK